MAYKKTIIVKNATYIQTLSAQFIYFGDFVKDSVVAPVDPVLGLIGKTIDQYNALTNVSNTRGVVISSQFLSSIVRTSTFDSSSNYYPVAGGSRTYVSAGTTIAIPANSGDVYVECVQLIDVLYGWVAMRLILGATGKLPSQFIYSKIFEHNAGYDIKILPGIISYMTGKVATNESTGTDRDSNVQMAATAHPLFLGYPRITSVDSNGLRIFYSGGTWSQAKLKTINYMSMVYIDYTSNNSFIDFLKNSNIPIKLTKSGSYIQLATVSSQLAGMDTRLCDGSGGAGTGTVTTAVGSNIVTGVGTAFNSQLQVGGTITIGGVTKIIESITSSTVLTTTTTWASVNSGVAFTYAKMSILWTQFMLIEMFISASEVSIWINEQKVLITKSNNIKVTRTEIDTAITTVGYPMDSGTSSVIYPATSEVIIGTTIPDALTLQKIRTVQKRNALR